MTVEQAMPTASGAIAQNNYVIAVTKFSQESIADYDLYVHQPKAKAHDYYCYF